MPAAESVLAVELAMLLKPEEVSSVPLCSAVVQDASKMARSAANTVRPSPLALRGRTAFKPLSPLAFRTVTQSIRGQF
jgi:hypothetical protein